MKKFLYLCMGGAFVVAFLCGAALYSYAAETKEKLSPSMGHDGARDVVVAKVNGTGINMVMLMSKMLDIAQKKYGQREISELVALKIKDEAMDILIIEELAFQKASEVVNGISSEVVEQTLEKLKEQKGGEKGFAEYLDREHMELDELRRLLTRTLTVKSFIEKEIDKKITITDNELKAAYLNGKDEYFRKEEEVQVTDIIFFLDPSLEASFEKILEIREEIINKQANDPTNLTPDGTFVVKEKILLDKKANKKIYDVAKKIGPLGISEPIEVDGTLHMIQLTGYQPEVAKDFEDVQDYIKGELRKIKKQALIDQWVGGLKEGAEIEIIDVTL